MKIRDFEEHKASGISLFFNNIDYDFMEHYRENTNSIDTYMIHKYAEFMTLDGVSFETWKKVNQSVLDLNAPNYKRMWDALEAQYDPTENYNRYEDSDVTSNVGEQTNNITYGDTVNTGTVANDNSETWYNNDKQTTTRGGDSQTTGARADTMNTTSHIHGNIGVTTNQQMIQSELDLRRFNLIEKIFDDAIQFSSILVDEGCEVF